MYINNNIIPKKLTCAPGNSAAEAITKPENEISMPIISKRVSFLLKNVEENNAISKGATAMNNILIPADTNFCAAKKSVFNLFNPSNPCSKK